MADWPSTFYHHKQMFSLLWTWYASAIHCYHIILLCNLYGIHSPAFNSKIWTIYTIKREIGKLSTLQQLEVRAPTSLFHVFSRDLLSVYSLSFEGKKCLKSFICLHFFAVFFLFLLTVVCSPFDWFFFCDFLWFPFEMEIKLKPL